MLAHAVEAALSEALGDAAIVPQRVNTIRKRLWIVWGDQQSAPGFLDDLGERAAPGLDNRDAARHRLEEKHPLRLVVGGRNRQHVQRAQEREFAISIDGAAVGELIAQTGLIETAANDLEIASMRSRQISCSVEPDGRRSNPPAKALIGIGKNVQSFFRRDA